MSGDASSSADLLPQILSRHAAQTPDALAFSFLERGEREGARLTFRDLHLRALSVMDDLMLRNLGGRPVLLMYPPGLDYVAAFCGCLYAGAIAVPAPYFLPKRASERIAAICRQAEPAAVLTLAELAEGEMEDPLLAGLGALPWIATDLLVPGVTDGGPRAVAPDDPAFLQFTSGSTRSPKGVTVSHGALVANLEMIRQAFGHGPHTRMVSWLPMFHDMGLVGCVLQPIYLGVPSVLMSPLAFMQKPARWLRAVSEHRATTSGAPNFAYAFCAQNIRADQLEGVDLGCWDVAFCGAEPVRPETLSRFAATFASSGFRAGSLYPCYGLSEATLFVSGGQAGQGLCTVSIDADALAEGSEVRLAESSTASPRTLASSGRSWGAERIAIVEPNGDHVVEPNRVGEICICGPHVAEGYWGRPEDGAQTFGAKLDGDAASWLRTGDLGFLLGGELYVTGRLKDVLIVRGAKHHPEDIEASVARSHPVLQSGGGAAFVVDGAEDSSVVVLQEIDRHGVRDLDLAAVTRAAIGAVTEQHGLRPDHLLLLRPGSLPRTTSGKVQRNRCREAYLSGSLTAAVARARGPRPAAGGGARG